MFYAFNVEQKMEVKSLITEQLHLYDGIRCCGKPGPQSTII